MAARKGIDWDRVFYDFAALSPPDRNLTKVAEALGVGRRTIMSIAKRHRWKQRLAAIDEKARADREKRAIRTLNERFEDTLRIIEAGRMRYAQRLRDPNYQMTGQEFFALSRLELLIEGRDTHKIGVGTVSEEFREMIRQLPVYTQERILVSAITGASYDEVLEIEAEMVSEEDDGPAD